MQEYTRRRHAFLLSEKHAKTPQATTILVTAIPDGLNTEDALYDIFNHFPRGVKKIWLTRYGFRRITIYTLVIIIPMSDYLLFLVCFQY